MSEPTDIARKAAEEPSDADLHLLREVVKDRNALRADLERVAKEQDEALMHMEHFKHLATTRADNLDAATAKVAELEARLAEAERQRDEARKDRIHLENLDGQNVQEIFKLRKERDQALAQLAELRARVGEGERP